MCSYASRTASPNNPHLRTETLPLGVSIGHYLLRELITPLPSSTLSIFHSFCFTEMRHLASGIRHLASGIWHLASGIWHLASGIWHLASCIWHLASGIWYLASGIWHQTSGIRHLEPGIRHLACGIWHHASGIWHLESGIRHLAPGIWHLAPGILHLIILLSVFTQLKSYPFLLDVRDTTAHKCRLSVCFKASKVLLSIPVQRLTRANHGAKNLR
jgi:hypothetical protein